MRDRRPSRRLALLFLVPMLAMPAWSQVIPQASDLLLDGEILRQAQQQAQRVTPSALALEGAVDPDEYIVGPGDRFTVTVGGQFSQELQSTVSADGNLLIPEVGRFSVAGLSLSDVDRLVRPALRRLYENVPAELALTQPRQFYVHVTGAVRAPGRHLVGPIARVEDAVRAAMDDDSPLSVIRQIRRANQVSPEAQMYPALRNVRVLHTDGSSISVDLRRYYTTGEKEHNPFLRDGDVLIVPAFDPFQNAISVSGAVLAPGLYDFRPGDTVGSVLTVAAGREALDMLESVRLVRVDGRSMDVSLAQSLGEDQSLQPGDRLIVQPPSPEMGSVEIEGRVLYPGEYPVRAGVTTVSDLIAMAGGLREDALANAIYLERRGTSRPGLSPGPDDRPSLTSRPLASANGALTPAEIELMIEEEAFRTLRLADLDFASRQYLLNELRRTPRIPLDLGSNLSRADQELPLRDGDRLVVPENPGGIYVFGQVARSGFVPYQPGLSPAGYVERAGDMTTAATDVFVRRAGSGYIVPAQSVEEVAPGDAIFVNRRTAADSPSMQQLALQEHQLRVQERQQWIQIGAAVLSTATAIVTALIFTN